MPRPLKPTDGRLKANRDFGRFMQRAVYDPWMRPQAGLAQQLCTPHEVRELFSPPAITRREWINTPVEDWHTLPDSSLLHFLFMGHTQRDKEAGRGPLDYGIETRLVHILRERARQRERGAN